MSQDREKASWDYVERNRVAWDKWAKGFVESGRNAWNQKTPSWGIWNTPESEARILPDKISGLDVIELGCGTAYVSAWLTRLGARVTAIDNSQEQLKTARELQQENRLAFTLLHGNAESVPRPDGSFDLAISEYGASVWCDPYRWIPETSRLLRPDGLLIFIVDGTILCLCTTEDNIPASPQLLRDYFDMHRVDVTDSEKSVEFHLGYGDWIRLLRGNGFEVENLLQFRPARGATTPWPYVKEDWARRWPSEEVWIARKKH